MSHKQVQILQYNVIFTPEDRGWYSAYAPELPGCVSQGETFEKTVENIKEAIELYLEDENPESFLESSKETEKQFMAKVEVKV